VTINITRAWLSCAYTLYYVYISMNYYRKLNRTYYEMLGAGYGRIIRRTVNRRTKGKSLVKPNIKLWFLSWHIDEDSL